MRLDGYVRVSRVAGRGGESFISPRVQRERIDAYVKAQGHRVVHWHEDLDEPGSKAARPGFQAGLARVEAGETDGIAVAKLDRFARSVADAAAAIRRIQAAGGQLVSVEDNFDSSTPMGKFALHMLLALGELELDRIRDNWATAQAHAVARGVHVASRVPTGYRRGDGGRLEPDPVAAPVIAELFRRRAAGSGWTTLAVFLDEAGIRGPYDNERWTPGTVASMIGNRVYLGEARSGKHVNPAAHEPLIGVADWQAAQGARAGSSPRNGDGLLLSGLVRCAGCRYRVKPDKMRDRDGTQLGFYRCRRRHPTGRCPAPIGVLARLLDPYVETAFLAALGPDGPLAEASTSTDAIEDATRRVEAAELELVAYRDETKIAELIGRDGFLAGLETRARAVDAARRTLAETHDRSALTTMGGLTPGALLEAWPTLSIGEKRAILTAAIDAVVVRATRGSGRSAPPSERALILWRGQAPDDLPRRGVRPPLASFPWPDDRPDQFRVAAGQHA